MRALAAATNRTEFWQREEQHIGPQIGVSSSRAATSGAPAPAPNTLIAQNPANISASVTAADLQKYRLEHLAERRLERNFDLKARVVDDTRYAGVYAKGSLMDLLLGDPAFKTFAELLKVAKLDFDLGSKDASFTVFCPTSFAINQALVAQKTTLLHLNSSPNLADILKAHIFVGLHSSQELTDGKHVQMWGGRYFMVRKTGGLQKIGDVPIQGMNMKATNGLVHAIGGVLGELAC